MIHRMRILCLKDAKEGRRERKSSCHQLVWASALHKLNLHLLGARVGVEAVAAIVVEDRLCRSNWYRLVGQKDAEARAANWIALRPYASRVLVDDSAAAPAWYSGRCNWRKSSARQLNAWNR